METLKDKRIEEAVKKFKKLAPRIFNHFGEDFVRMFMTLVDIPDISDEERKLLGRRLLNEREKPQREM